MKPRESKNIQIPREIFLDLCKWHLFNLHDPEREQRIKQALQGKMNSTRNRENYSITDANANPKN